MAPYLLSPYCVADPGILPYGSLVQALHSAMEGSCHMATNISLEANSRISFSVASRNHNAASQAGTRSFAEQSFPSVPNGELDWSSLENWTGLELSNRTN